MSRNNNLPYISDHALNKADHEAIVYRDAAGNRIRLTAADFSSREEFEKWKAWSDADYAEIERGDRQYYAHKLPLHDQDFPTPSAEQEILDTIERIENEKADERYLVRALACLTETQRRRFVLHYVGRLSKVEIANLEGVTESAVRKSIADAHEKISVFNCKHSMNMGSKMGDFSVLSERGRNPITNLENLIYSVKGTKPV